MAGSRLPLLRRLPERPAGLVAGTRWLFHLCALLVLGLTAAGGLPGGTPGAIALLGCSTLALAGSWSYGYRAGRRPLWGDALDALAFFAFALACPAPVAAFPVAFSAQWFRAVYGRTAHVAAYTAGVVAAMVSALLLWTAVPWHDGPTAAAPVLGPLPVLVVNAVVSRHLALGLFARDAAQRRDAALADLGTSLLGLTDRDEIYARTWAAASRVCASQPGMVVITVLDEGGHLLLRGQTAGFPPVPGTLPRGIVTADVAGATGPCPPPPELVTVTGATDWHRLPMPEIPHGWMLVGAQSVPSDVITLFRALMNQVALALRNAHSHGALEAQALTDPLTGLPNRTAFTAALAGAPADGTWVLYLDLDDFKVVNDGFGHATGDRLLRCVAERLAGAVREEDLCARLGGDEFAVVLHGATEEEAHATARRLVELLSSPVVLDGRVLSVGASVGLAPSAAERGMDVVQRADIAMYAAKRAGKNRVQSFTPSLLTSEEEARFEAELRFAVDGGRLLVVHQPIVSAEDGRCVAVEALVRWEHPTRGLLSPPQFLDVAERTGLIVALGEHVLRRACADVRDWSDDGRPLLVHVNASPTQLAHPRFLPSVREALAESDLEPERLVVEITESSALDSPGARAAIDELAAMGVGVAVDDFGTGYSALSLLRTVPLDIVKIDKSFVAGAATELVDQAVLSAIVRLARDLGLVTVAEGVEDADQQRFVERAGITAVQGYLHLRPVPAGELACWLADPARRAVTVG
jgi:diguanylate cyclase (GGDEF)-like protein